MASFPLLSFISTHSRIFLSFFGTRAQKQIQHCQKYTFVFVCVLDVGRCCGAHLSLRQGPGRTGPSRVLLRVHVNGVTARRAIWIYDVGGALISLRFCNRPSRSEHLNAKTTRSSFIAASIWEKCPSDI